MNFQFGMQEIRLMCGFFFFSSSSNFFTVRPNSANDKLMIRSFFFFFFFCLFVLLLLLLLLFFQETGFGISCKLSPCIKCQNLFSDKIKTKNISKRLYAVNFTQHARL